jgi:uncharacterized phage protein gp47/JayE
MTITGQFYPTVEDVVNVYLRSLAGSASRKGLTVNVLPGSEYWMRARAISAVVVPAFANNKLGLAAVNPLTAQGDDVIAGAAAFGVPQRPASPATGYVRIGVVLGTVNIPADWAGTMADGTAITVVGVHNAMANNSLVLVTTVDGGRAVNQSAGLKGSWDDPSIGALKPTFTVAAGGLADGEDEDSVETVRQAWLERLANPGKGGNWAHVAQLARDSSASIADVYVYPAQGGAGSYGVAIMSRDGDGVLSTAVVAAAAAAIVAELPGHTNLNCTTIAPEYVDVIMTARAPLPKSAGGGGGGWLDAVPWPNSTSGAVKVNSYDSATGRITTNATDLNGVAIGNHIGIWDPTFENADGDVVGKMYEFVVSEALDPGNITIKSSTGFPKNFTGCYISAGSVGLANWATTAVAAFATIGPGEKTSNVWLLPRALRKPSQDVKGPQRVESRITTEIQSAHDEISNLGYVARYATGTTTPLTTPTLPASALDAPNRLTLKHLAFTAETT